MVEIKEEVKGVQHRLSKIIVKQEVESMRLSLSRVLGMTEFNLADHEQRQLLQAALTIADSLDLIAEVVAE